MSRESRAAEQKIQLRSCISRSGHLVLNDAFAIDNLSHQKSQDKDRFIGLCASHSVLYATLNKRNDSRRCTSGYIMPPGSELHAISRLILRSPSWQAFQRVHRQFCRCPVQPAPLELPLPRPTASLSIPQPLLPLPPPRILRRSHPRGH